MSEASHDGQAPPSSRQEEEPDARSVKLGVELRRRGSDAKFTIYPLAGHDVGSETYNNPELYAWLLRHKRTPLPEAR